MIKALRAMAKNYWGVVCIINIVFISVAVFQIIGHVSEGGKVFTWLDALGVFIVVFYLMASAYMAGREDQKN